MIWSLFVSWTFLSFRLLQFHSGKGVWALTIVLPKRSSLRFCPGFYPHSRIDRGLLSVIVQQKSLKQTSVSSAARINQLSIGVEICACMMFVVLGPNSQSNATYYINATHLKSGQTTIIRACQNTVFLCLSYACVVRSWNAYNLTGNNSCVRVCVIQCNK